MSKWQLVREVVSRETIEVEASSFDTALVAASKRTAEWMAHGIGTISIIACNLVDLPMATKTTKKPATRRRALGSVPPLIEDAAAGDSGDGKPMSFSTVSPDPLHGGIPTPIHDQSDN